VYGGIRKIVIINVGLSYISFKLLQLGKIRVVVGCWYIIDLPLLLCAVVVLVLQCVLVCK
jgi:hypothetical protein